MQEAQAHLTANLVAIGFHDPQNMPKLPDPERDAGPAEPQTPEETRALARAMHALMGGKETDAE